MDESSEKGGHEDSRSQDGSEGTSRSDARSTADDGAPPSDPAPNPPDRPRRKTGALSVIDRAVTPGAAREAMRLVREMSAMGGLVSGLTSDILAFRAESTSASAIVRQMMETIPRMVQMVQLEHEKIQAALDILSPAKMFSMAAARDWPESEASRSIRLSTERHRKAMEQVLSGSFAEAAAAAGITRSITEMMAAATPGWREAMSAVSLIKGFDTRLLAEASPWPGAYSSGPSVLYPATDDGPDDDTSAAPPEVEPPPMVMPARPSWRAHPGRRRSYARAIERRDQREGKALAGIVSAEQWRLLEQIAHAWGCSVAVLVQGVLGILAGAPAPEAQHHIWALGFGTAPVQDAEAPDEASNRVLIRDSGGVFEVSYRGKSGQFRKLKGLQMLKHLIDNPGTRFGAYELWALAGGAGEREEWTASQDMAPGRTSDFGPMEVLDRQALKELKDRLDEIKEELSEARGDNDQARIKVLTEEREGILGQLPLKMGGKASRKVHSKLEQRARTNVGNLVAYALRVIKRNMPKAEAEIRVHLKMGYHCSYGGPHV